MKDFINKYYSIRILKGLSRKKLLTCSSAKICGVPLTELYSNPVHSENYSHWFMVIFILKSFRGRLGLCVVIT